ncbi:MAG: carbon-nitrogen hydrolase family protein [Ignisphaera sp.]|uniref:Carbon-nitrogen hydrolase family protein n=1 Tax=Ignisphaera aggregans TaxID=334771 RepID=A0A7J3MYV3_9CREN
MSNNVKSVMSVLHSVIDLGRYEQNMQRIEEMIERAKNEGAEVVLLPAMMNGVSIFDLKKNLKIKRVTETIPGKTSEHLARIANKFKIYILSGPILERRGSKIYRSAFLVDPSMNIKSVISQVNTPSKFGQSSSPPVVNICGLTVGIFIAEDIHLPELSLLMKITNVDIVVFYPYPQISVDKITAIMKTRSLELNTMIISIGYTIRRKDEEILFMPTSIVDENGTVIHEVLDKSPKIIKVNLDKGKSKINVEPSPSPSHKKLLKVLNRAISYYIK